MNHNAIIKAQDVADILQMPIASIYKYTKNGSIPAVKIGKHWRYSREEIISLVTKEKV